MKATITTSKLVFSILAGCLISVVLPANIARADYLVRPVPVQFVECAQCDICGACIPHNTRRHSHTRHHTVNKHHRHSHYHAYRTQCRPPADFVTFYGEPAPRNRGRWVDTTAYDNYDPDMSTGDDDPTIYPGMDIDN